MKSCKDRECSVLRCVVLQRGWVDLVGFQGHLFVVCWCNLELITSETQRFFWELDVAQEWVNQNNFCCLNLSIFNSLLLGLLVSKFKRGGVNWAYKISARTHNFQYSRGKKNRLFLHETDWFFRAVLAQFEFVQCKNVINREL